MSKFTDQLWSDLAREHGSTLAHADRPEAGRAGVTGALRRPRVIAGSSLGLAGIAAALVFGLSGSATQSAYAITKHSDGSLAINLDTDGGLIGANRKLAKMGTDEHIWFQMAPGAAPTSGVVNCEAQGDVSGPAITVTVGPGDSNTETIPSGNTGAGTWHVQSCWRGQGTDTRGPMILRGRALKRWESHGRKPMRVIRVK